MTYLVLDTINKNLLLHLKEGVITSQPTFTAHYYDSLEANIDELSSDGVLNGITYIEAVAPPALTIKRIVKEVTVHNSDTVDHTFYLTLNNDGDKRIISAFFVPASFTTTVSTEGYRGERGYQGNQGVQGNQGNQGVQGSQGDDGTSGQGADKIAFNSQIGTTYTIVTADAGKMLRMSNANAITLTIDTNANQPFDVGAVISVEQSGEGVVTVTPVSGSVTIQNAAKKTYGQYSVIQIYKVDTDTWNVIGGVL
jgi:hypothetical protein